MKRISVVLAVLSLVVVSSCSQEKKVAQLPSSEAAPKPASPPAAVDAKPAEPTVAANKEEASSSPFFSATTEAHRKSVLSPKVSSTVTRVHVRDGDVVKQGQPLVTLDTQDFLLRAQQAESNLEGARVQVNASKLDWDRTKALLDEKAVPQSQFDMVDAKYKGALASLQSAQVAVAMCKKALQDAVVRAPFTGIIVKRMVSEGEYASVMPATQLVSIEEIDPIDLRIQVPASDMNEVQPGDQVQVRFPALDKTMDLRLTRVVAASDPRTRTFTAIVEIPNPNHELRSGLYAEVKLAPVSPTAQKNQHRANQDKKD